MVISYLIAPLLLIGIFQLLLKNDKYIKVLHAFAVVFCIGYTAMYFSTFEIKVFTDIRSSMFLLFVISFVLSSVYYVYEGSKINTKELGLIYIYAATGFALIFTANLLELVIVWEVLAIVAAFIIASNKTTEARSAALKYFYMHGLGGVLLLIGVIGYYYSYSSLEFLDYVLNFENIFNIFIFLGVIINLAIPPFSSWLIDGYSKCSEKATLFLSIFTTKASLMFLAIMFHGTFELFYIGAFMVIYASILSFIETKIRKIMGYAIIHSLGVCCMFLGVATFSNLGAFTPYIFIAVLYKIILFMTVIAIKKKHQAEDLKELKGKIYALSITGIGVIFLAIQAIGLPFTSAFFAKTILSSYLTDSSLIKYVSTFAFALVTLNLAVRIPMQLLTFKKQDTFEANRFHNIMILVVMVMVQASVIFISDISSIITTYNIIHSVEIIALGIAIYIPLYFMLRNKGTSILNFIETCKNLLFILLKNIYYHTFAHNFLGKFAENRLENIRQLGMTDYSEKSMSRYATIGIVTVIVVIYIYTKI